MLVRVKPSTPHGRSRGEADAQSRCATRHGLRFGPQRKPNIHLQATLPVQPCAPHRQLSSIPWRILLRSIISLAQPPMQLDPSNWPRLKRLLASMIIWSLPADVRHQTSLRYCCAIPRRHRGEAGWENSFARSIECSVAAHECPVSAVGSIPSIRSTDSPDQLGAYPAELGEQCKLGLAGDVSGGSAGSSVGGEAVTRRLARWCCGSAFASVHLRAHTSLIRRTFRSSR